MEIPQIIIDKAFKKSEKLSSFGGFFKLYQLLENIDVSLLTDTGKQLDEIARDLGHRINLHQFFLLKDEKSQIDWLSQLIYMQNYYFNKSVKDIDMKSLVIFLLLIHKNNLKINLSLFLNSRKSHELKPLVKKIVKAFPIEIVDLGSLGNLYHEKQSLASYKEGVKNKSLLKVYDTINKIERGCGWLFFSWLLNDLIGFLFLAGYDEYIDCLESRETPIDAILFLDLLSQEELKIVAKSFDSNNKWVNAEIIRQIAMEEKYISFTLDEEYIPIVSKILNNILNDDFDFFKQVITCFSRSYIVNGALGGVMASMEKDQLEEVVEELFQIDKYHHRIDHKNLLLDSYCKKISDERVKDLFVLVYQKWRKFIDSFEDYLSGIMLTDYPNFILGYYFTTLSDKELLEKMNKLIEEIELLDWEWSKDYSYQSIRYYLLHSKLYLLTFVYKDKKLINKTLVSDYKQLVSNRVHYCKFRVSKPITSSDGKITVEEYFKKGFENLNANL